MLHFQPELIDLLPAAVAFTIVGLTMLCCGRTAPKPQKHYDDKVEDLIASGSIKGFASVAKATTGNQFAYHKARAPNGQEVESIYQLLILWSISTTRRGSCRSRA